MTTILTGCATPPEFREPDQTIPGKRELAARRTAYKRLLSHIQPGMTRRQLYALLPPRRTPDAYPPRAGMVVGVALYSYHEENHPLDRDFSLSVSYRLASRKEYPEKDKSYASLDDLLFGTHEPEKPIPSRENMDDELIYRPVLGSSEHPQIFQVGQSLYEHLYIPKPTEGGGN